MPSVRDFFLSRVPTVGHVRNAGETDSEAHRMHTDEKDVRCSVVCQHAFYVWCSLENQ